jgi:hypothetical protein
MWGKNVCFEARIAGNSELLPRFATKKKAFFASEK